MTDQKRTGDLIDWKARAERAETRIETVRRQMKYVIECLCEEAEITQDEDFKERSYKLAESCETTLALIHTPRETVFKMVSHEEWQSMDERDSNPNVAEPRQPTVKKTHRPNTSCHCGSPLIDGEICLDCRV